MFIAYDTVLKRPGCVVVQAGMGGSSSIVSQHFDAVDWLTYPTPDMKLFPTTEEQIPTLVEITRQARLERERR